MAEFETTREGLGPGRSGAARARELQGVGQGWLWNYGARRAAFPQLPGRLWARIAEVHVLSNACSGGKRAMELALLGRGWAMAACEHPDLDTARMRALAIELERREREERLMARLMARMVVHAAA